MTELGASATAAAAVVVAAAAVVVGVLLVLVTRSWRPAVPVFLDLVLAAALLRLGSTDDWDSILGVAGLLVVRTAVASAGRADPGA